MNARSILTIALATVVVLAALTGPAAAKKYGVSQAGRGTWSHATAGVTFAGDTTGAPFDGATVASIEADDGTLPRGPAVSPRPAR